MGRWEEWAQLRQRYATLVVAVLWLLFGVLYLIFAEGFDFVEACYISVQLISTVGYGDFPTRKSMQWFLCIYLLGCIIWVAFAASQYLEYVNGMAAGVVRSRMRAAEEHLGVVKSDEDAKKIFGRFNDLIASSLLFFLMIFIGAAFYATVEKCTCVQEWHRIEGCQPGPQCPSTGGLTLTWGDSFYMSVVTLTTCGFGDRHPRTHGGMVFAIFWIFLGTLTAANFVRAFTSYFFVFWRKKYVLRERLSTEIMEAMDKNNDGTITREEFTRYLLLKFDLISQDVLDQMDKQFALFDRRHSGVVRMQTVADIYEEQAVNKEVSFWSGISP